MIGTERQLNPAHSGFARATASARASVSGSGRQCDSVKNNTSPRALSAAFAQRSMSWSRSSSQHPVLWAEQAADLVQLGDGMVRRARDDDLELLARKQLLLRPASHAADGLAPVELERDDHGEPHGIRLSRVSHLRLGFGARRDGAGRSPDV